MRSMRRMTVAAALAAAVGGVTLLPGGFTSAQRVTQQPANSQTKPAGPAAPATAPAAQVDVPVKVVVLYSSGVGYFEHFGTVRGDGSTELRFKTQQINDILKSLVLQDMDGGKVAAVTYPSQDPVAKTLRSFQVDITSNPSLAELLNQLRGAKVSVNAGAEELQGTVVGVEKQRPVGKGDDGKLAEVAVLNLLTEGGIRSVQLDDVRNLKIDDPQLREELQRALQALSQARNKDKKPVSVSFRGQGERRVRLGYVVEAPVWKTSYRLILSDAGEGAGNQDGAAPQRTERASVSSAQGTEPGRAGPIGAARPGSLPRADGGASASLPRANDGASGAPPRAEGAGAEPSPLPGDGRLQGWAIIENQTDSDWTDVQLSLVSGRPISFIQDLYQPLYIPRPVVKPELYASLRPQTYDAGMMPADGPQEEFMQQRGGVAGGGVPPAQAAPAARQRTLSKRTMGRASDMGVLAEEGESLAAIDASSSVASVASAAKVGELFQYTVGNVNLPRQKSAMIPVVTDAVQIERLSIYNQAVLPRNPLTGARVRNTTGKHLLQGPVTVLDAGAYAGDARIDDVPPGQERLLSYGVDQQVIVDATKSREESAIQTGRLVKGVLEITNKQVFTQEYVNENKSDRDKTLVIEHPVRQGWKLVDPPKADESTEAVYRFKGRVGAGKQSKLAVKQEIVSGQRIAVLPSDVGQLEFFSKTGQIPKEVRDALVKAIGMKYAMVETQRQIEQRQQRTAEVTQEQSRIRENLKTVAANSEYSSRLLKKLDEQETQIESIQKEVAGLRQKLQEQQKALEDYLAGLNVG